MQQATAPQRWIVLLPNALSALRLALAVLFPWISLHEPWGAAAIALAGLTDFADGWIARRFSASSWIGGQLDAIADKGFVLCVLITFVWRDVLAPWQVILLLSRDIVVIAIAAYATAKRQWDAFRRMPARPMGKTTTAAIFVLMLAASLHLKNAWALTTLFALTAVCSAAAALDYYLIFRDQHRQFRKKQRELGAK